MEGRAEGGMEGRQEKRKENAQRMKNEWNSFTWWYIKKSKIINSSIKKLQWCLYIGQYLKNGGIYMYHQLENEA